jgi:hypothetical protein
VALKDHVTENKKVFFQYYSDGILYYKTELGLLFEVPVADTGRGIFNAEDKALNFMRWIRPQLERNEQGLKESHGYVFATVSTDNAVSNIYCPSCGHNYSGNYVVKQCSQCGIFFSNANTPVLG